MHILHVGSWTAFTLSLGHCSLHRRKFNFLIREKWDNRIPMQELKSLPVLFMACKQARHARVVWLYK